MRWFPVSVVYLDRDIEGRYVSATCTGCDLEGALERILSGTSLTWMRSGQQIVLMSRPVPPQRILATLSGSVIDSVTGQGVAGVNVLLEDSSGLGGQALRRWCPTNEYGFYSLRRVERGTYVIRYRALGYHPLRLPVTVADGGEVTLDVSLQPEEIRLQEVTVEGHRTALLPAEGYAHGTYFRATPTDQNQYFLDGARIYNPGHFGSVLSTFNLDILTDVEVPVGGVPPYYGGRIGGILDLSMRDGSRQRLSGIAGTGSLGSQLAVEGPLGASTSYLVSWRRGYPQAAVPFLEDYGTPSPLGTTEVVAKLSHRLSASQHLTLSGYAGSDSYSDLVEEPGLRLSNVYGWDNRAASLRWNAIASPSLFLSANAVYTAYDFRLEHLLESEQPPATSGELVSEFTLEEASIRASAEHYYDENHTVRGGVELVHRRIGGSINEFSTQIAPLSLQDRGIWELSVYLQDQWAILPSVIAGLGARATSYTGVEGSYSAIDPRFSLVVTPGDATRLYASLVTVSQFVHTYRNSGVFMLYPPIFWYPSTEKIRPSTAIQATLGVQHSMRDDAYALGAESFYRTTHDLHGFYVVDPARVVTDLTDALLFGTGRSYGVELSARKRTGNLRWSASYTLSWTDEIYDVINNGEPIPSPFDRRHEVQAGLSWAFADGWGLSALCVLTFQEARSFESAAFPSEGAAVPMDRYPVDVNGNRLPGFQRLELEAVRRFAIDNFLCTVALRMLNAYGLVDPYVWDLRPTQRGTVAWGARLEELDLLPMFPTLSLTVRF